MYPNTIPGGVSPLALKRADLSCSMIAYWYDLVAMPSIRLYVVGTTERKYWNSVLRGMRIGRKVGRGGDEVRE